MSKKLTPREAATSMEIARVLPPGDDERAIGYGVIGLPFSGGDYLVLRDFHAASFGPPYRSVWHRNPAGEWRVYTTGRPEESCPRYISADLVEPATVTPIDVTWLDDVTMRVFIDDVLDWTVECRATALTTMMSAMSMAMPMGAWTNKGFHAVMGRMATAMMGAGRMRLSGTHLPNGQSFMAAPRRIWEVTRSTALISGRDAGVIGPLVEQEFCGDFPLPQKGYLFADGFGHFENFDPTRHTLPTTAR